MQLKKHKCCLGILALNALLLFGGTTANAGENNIQITVPSEFESTIAPGRNFYVKGTFSEIGFIPDGSRLSVQLKDVSGTVVRNVSTEIKDNKNLSEDLITYHTDATIIKDTGMPDLVWDAQNTETKTNGDIKCFYNDTGFAAMISGGKTDNSIDDRLGFTDGLGIPYEALPKGMYQVKVNITSPDGTLLGSTDQEIQIDTTSDKILTRFSGAEHMKKFQAFAAANGFRIYQDPFPGYWSIDNSTFCENAPEWRAADATEYTEGNVHFIIYNVKKSSTTYGVELGLLQNMGAINSRLTSYYYSTGEPGMLGSTDSTIEAFAKGDKLQLVRAEISETLQEDNVYDVNSADKPTYDMDFSDGISLSENQYLSIFGVTAPIQLDASDIHVNDDNTYILDNKIQTICYTVTNGEKSFEYKGDVSLNRVENGSKTFSELEFKHVIPISADMAGAPLEVHLQGYDTHGNAVDGTQETFILTITSKGGEDPVPTPAPTPPKKEENAVPSLAVVKAVKTGDAETAFHTYAMFGLLSCAVFIAIKRKSRHN